MVIEVFLTWIKRQFLQKYMFELQFQNFCKLKRMISRLLNDKE